MLYILLASIFIMVASLSGVLILWRALGRRVEANLRFLVSLSAGVFLSIAYYLSLETIELTENLSVALGWIAGGAAITFLLFRFVPAFHHHHDEHEEDHTHNHLDVRRILFGDAVHNLADGILLVSAFAFSPTLGFITAGSIFMHEIVQEISEFFVLKQGGFSTKKTLLINFAVSSTIIVGAFGGFFLINAYPAIEAILLGLSAGSFLLVVFFDLIPQSVRASAKPTHYLAHILWFVFGVVLMATVLTLTPHAHEHSEDGHAEHLPGDDHSHSADHKHTPHEEHHKNHLDEDEEDHAHEDEEGHAHEEHPKDHN